MNDYMHWSDEIHEQRKATCRLAVCPESGCDCAAHLCEHAIPNNPANWCGEGCITWDPDGLVGYDVALCHPCTEYQRAREPQIFKSVRDLLA